MKLIVKETAMNEQDVTLYADIQKGDQVALETLYDKYEKLLFSFIFKMTDNRELTEEVISFLENFDEKRNV